MLNIFGFQRKAPITWQEFCSDSSNVKGQFKSSPSTNNKLSTSLTIIKGENGDENEIMGALTPKWFVL